ncbi:MAG: CHAD domain-containing protein [Burkholderiales bacterium]|nr:CHAD domain-containing protein [Burkholderiales bacterium]
MSEIELKFGVDPARARAIDAALRRAKARRGAIESRYFDTPDHRLADAGLTLRLRRSARAWEQTLKAPTERFGERLEETVPRPGRWGPDGPPLDPSRHDGSAAGKLLRAALGDGEAATTLVPVHICSVVRRSVEIEAGGARVELAFDRGEIRAGAASTPVCELEYELKSGDVQALVAFGRAGVREHGLWLSTVSKGERGDRLFRGAATVAAVKARPPRLRHGMTGREIFQAAMKACLDQVLANASELAAGQRDDEIVHQLRIGLRRTRTAWSELAPLAGPGAADWDAPLAEAFRRLGEYRDRRTVVASLQARLADSGSPAPTLRVSQEEPVDPVDVVRDGAFQCALLDGLALTLGEASVGASEEATDFIASRLDRLDRHLQRAAKRFAGSKPEAQHLARKRLKRLRYLAELVGGLYKPERVERYLERLGPAQDALGLHVDLLVGLEMARAAAEAGQAESWFNVGWLSAQLAPSARGGEKALRRAARAEPFWKR